MARLMTRLRNAMSSLGNEGAVANVLAEMGRAAAARHAVEQLELRMAPVTVTTAASRAA
jgi:hypothetical protein